MDILVLTNLYPSPVQPHLAPWNRAQLSALSERHSVRVISPVLWTEEWSARRQRSERIPVGRRSTDGNVSVEYPRYVYPPKIMRGTYGSCFRMSSARAFRRAIRCRRPDLVYACWAYPDGWAAVQLAAQAKLPVVVRVLGSDVLSLNDFPGRRERTIEALTKANCVIAVSQDLAQKVTLLGVPGSSIEVVYNGLDSDIFCPGSRGDARTKLNIASSIPTVLFVGNLVPVKQVENLIDACSILKNAGTAFHCHLLGGGVLRASLAARIQQLGLSSHVTLHGQKDQSELVHWYRASDVVVLPSRSEGIPNVLLEATACGIPFVASRVGGIPEIEKHAASRLVEPDDVQGLAQAISKILSGGGIPAHAAAPRPRSWEQSALDLEAVLQKVLSNSDASRVHLHN